MELVARSRVVDRPLLTSAGRVSDYLSQRLRFSEIEQVLAIFLDRAKGLIADEVLWTGSTTEAPIYVGRLFHRALDLGASGLILVHNHPSGDPTPSIADKQLTRRVASAGSMLEVTLIDHLIVARSGTTSMRAAGML